MPLRNGQRGQPAIQAVCEFAPYAGAAAGNPAMAALPERDLKHLQSPDVFRMTAPMTHPMIDMLV